MVDLGSVFGKGSVAEQFLVWNVLSQLAMGILNPAVQTISNEVWQLDPNVPVPPATLAAMVNRGLLDMADGINESSKTGVGEPQFRKLVQVDGTGPTLVEAIELLRRGWITEGGPGDTGTTFFGAMKDAGVRDEWIGALASLKIQKPSGEAALNALLQGQITEQRALALWLQDGQDPDWFTDAFNSNGTAPTPDMAGTMANRGIIPWDGSGPGVTSFEQAFLEGPWRNKWEPSMRKLMEYLPPPRTVTAMVRDGSLTDALALQLFEQEGLTPELAAAYLASAHHTTAETDKNLAKGEIIALYKAHKIDQAQATKLLETLKYSAANAALIIALADLQNADTHLTAAMNKVHGLYVSHKITREAAVSALKELKVGDAQITSLLTLWDVETTSNVRQLSEAQIVDAFALTLIPQGQAQTELENLGYTPLDAWILLSIKNKSALPGRPGAGATPGVNP